MNTRKKERFLIRLILILCFGITMLACALGVLNYRSNLRRTYQNEVHVELTDFIENIRYSLHFGKDIESFYRMNELLTAETAEIEDLEGLYVVSEEGEVLFSTDGRELSGKVLRLLDGNAVEGDQFYAGMPLSTDGSSRLIARCSSREILLQQSDYLFRFLLKSIAGFGIAELLLLLASYFLRGKRGCLPTLLLILSAWIVILVVSGGNYAYRDYSEGMEKTRNLIAESVYRDVERVKEMGIKESSIAPPDTYLSRYVNEIDEVESVAIDENENIIVTFRTYGQRIIMDYVLQGLVLFAVVFLVLVIGNAVIKRRPVDTGTTFAAPVRKASIKTRLQRMVLAISATALVITSVLGVFIMMVIRSQSETALTVETQSNLTALVKDKAALAEARLEHYEELAAFFANYLSSVYAHPKDYGNEAPATGENEYFCTTIRRTAAVDLSDYEDEVKLSYHLMDVLYPFTQDEDSDIAEYYWGDENGCMTLYEKETDLTDPEEIYDYWGSGWYSAAKKERDVIFTDIYQDAFGNGLTITCAAPYYDKDGEFMGVFGLDVLISDIYDELVKLDLGEGAYAFLVDSSGMIISPEGDNVSLAEGEKLDESACELLMNSDGAVFERNGIYYTGAQIPDAGWTLCIHAPADLTLSTVRTIDNEIITAIIAFVIVFIVILLIVAAIISRVASGIADPIIALGQDVAEISGGNLDHQAEVRTDDEIGELARSFNGMSSALKEYVENVRRMTAEQERLGAELSVATRIQADMLPSVFPAFPERKDFDIYASMTPAKEVGGDFYDFFLIDQDHLGLVMADVSGKGVPAALFMVITKTLIKNHALSGENPAEILTAVNRQLCENNDEMLFVTAWVGILTLSTGALASADAGHEYPAIRRKGASAYELVISEHFPPLGTMPDNTYVETDLTLEKGDMLFLYTDGVPDARNEEKEKFGNDRMLSSLNQHASEAPEALLRSVKADLDAFIGEREQFDDITMLSLEYKG